MCGVGVEFVGSGGVVGGCGGGGVYGGFVGVSSSDGIIAFNCFIIFTMNQPLTIHSTHLLSSDEDTKVYAWDRVTSP